MTTTKKLTLYQPATYQIKVPGVPDNSWEEWAGEINVSVENQENGSAVTTLTGTIDQAALHGLLRRLYSMCLPVISVVCTEID